MAATFATLVLLALLKVSICSPVKPSTVEERIQQLEDAAELQYEFTNTIDQRLSVLETFVAELMQGNSTDAHLNDTLSKTDLTDLQDELRHQFSSRTNDSVPVLTGYAATRAAGDAQVAFHAYASTNRQLNNNQGIVYDAYEINYGGGYTASDGIFDVPVSGVYIFTWTISTSRFYAPITTHLIVDGVTRGILTSDSDGTSSIVGAGSHPATGVVITYAPAGKHVFIKAVNLNTRTASLESNDLIRSTFSGWLLF